MIWHVYQRAIEADIGRVIVATDDERIASVCPDVCMTGECHSGTDRIAEVIRKLRIPDDEVIINLQGDEPFMPPELIRRVSELRGDISTVCYRGDGVRVVLDSSNFALYFCRQPISPWSHIGLYAYRAGFVTQFCEWGPCEIEVRENLEQLRALWHRAKIYVYITDTGTVSVDSPGDLNKLP